MDSNSSNTGDFSVHAAPGAGDEPVITVYGELDRETAPELGGAIDRASPPLVVSRACGFVDSTGIAILVRGALRLREAGRQLILRGVQERVERTFRLAGIDSHPSIRIEPQPASS